MFHICRAAFTLLLLTLCLSCNQHLNPSSSRVLVFGIDGGTWSVIEPMFAAGELPNLRGVYERGIHGVLQSRPPISSPVVWTTIFTGKLPDEHGVKDWSTSQSKHRRVKSIWEITTEKGIATSVFNVPATWPPSPTDGVMFSGFPLSGSTMGGNTGTVVDIAKLMSGPMTGCYQQSAEGLAKAALTLAPGAWSPYLEIRIRARPDVRAVVRAKRLSESEFYLSPCYRIDDALVVTSPSTERADAARKLGQPYVPEGPGWSKYAEATTPEYLYEHLLQIADVQARTAGWYASEAWRLLIYVDTLVDRVSHPYWAYMHPDDYGGMDSERAVRYRETVRDAYRASDRHLGEVLRNVASDTYVLVVSDHGFRSSPDKTKHIGAHDPDGIYLVSGPGMSGQDGQRAFIEDVAPTILHLLGLPVAKDMKGEVMPAIATASGREVAHIDTYESDTRDHTNLPVDAKTWEQLRGLGYVDGAPPRESRQKDRKVAPD